MTKSPHAFRSIGEVSRLVGVATHVLRYWEAQFPLLSPVKRGDGRRYYRPDDVLLAAGICEALREEGLTIRGAKKLMAKDRGEMLRTRGRLKLGEQLGFPPEFLPEPRPAKSRARKADSPVEADPIKTPIVQDAATEVESLPLFPEDGSGEAPSNIVWLSRLTQTANALREREAPLPEEAHDLAQALRAAREAGR